MKNLIHKILKEEFEDKKNIFVPHNIEKRHEDKSKRDQEKIQKGKEEFKELLSQPYKMQLHKNGVEFLNDNNEWMFIYDIKNKVFWIDYPKIWSIFTEKYSLNDQQIRELTTSTLREVYNLQGVTTEDHYGKYPIT